MGQMVVWTEVFPWRRCHMPQDPLIPGYIEPDARWFLLVVGMVGTSLGIYLFIEKPCLYSSSEQSCNMFCLFVFFAEK